MPNLERDETLLITSKIAGVETDKVFYIVTKKCTYCRSPIEQMSRRSEYDAHEKLKWAMQKHVCRGITTQFNG